MNWIILLLAGLFEVSLTFCLGKARVASGVGFYLWGSGFLASTVLSMTLLAKAVQTLPLGTAYAIWTGIGAVGTVLIGIFRGVNRAFSACLLSGKPFFYL